MPIRDFRKAALDLLNNRNLIFKPGLKQKVSVFAYIVDYTISAIYVQNNTDLNVTISRNSRMGDVVEYKIDGCFLATLKNVNFAAKPFRS